MILSAPKALAGQLNCKNYDCFAPKGPCGGPKEESTLKGVAHSEPSHSRWVPLSLQFGQTLIPLKLDSKLSPNIALAQVAREGSYLVSNESPLKTRTAGCPLVAPGSPENQDCWLPPGTLCGHAGHSGFWTLVVRLGRMCTMLGCHHVTMATMSPW